MYEQSDGILAWGDLICASSAEVPLSCGAPWYLYMGSKTALCSSTWPLCTSTWALQTDLWSHETSKRPPGQFLERFQISPRGSGSQKTP